MFIISRSSLVCAPTTCSKSSRRVCIAVEVQVYRLVPYMDAESAARIPQEVYDRGRSYACETRWRTNPLAPSRPHRHRCKHPDPTPALSLSVLTFRGDASTRPEGTGKNPGGLRPGILKSRKHALASLGVEQPTTEGARHGSRMTEVIRNWATNVSSEHVCHRRRCKALAGLRWAWHVSI